MHVFIHASILVLGDLKIKRLFPVPGSSLSNGPFDHVRRNDIKIKGALAGVA